MTNGKKTSSRRQRRRLRLEQFEPRRLLAADFGESEASLFEDLNGDGKVSAADALMIINQMNRARLGGSTGDLNMDLNGDGRVGASDALRIINRMNRDRLGGGNPVDPNEFRSIDGTGNNLRHPLWGSAGIELVRLVDADYADGISQPSGDDRPSARLVSNLVSAQDESMPMARRLSDLSWQWGQFIDHDIDLTRGESDEPFNIPVPRGDEWFDPAGTGDAEIGMMRSVGSDDSGTGIDNPRQQVNDITAFIDGSMVYGSDARRAEALRDFSGGRLKTSVGDLLPLNEPGLPNAGGTSNSMFLAGDIRANEQVGLTSMHTLWVREHNRIADSIATEDDALSDEMIFQRARAIVIGELQAITFNEYLPAVLGQNAIRPYRGYDPSVNPSISNLFATAAYRYGHTQLSAELLRLSNDGSEVEAGNLALRDAFFNPSAILDSGIDPVLKGLATAVAQEIDTRVVDDVRNFLFGPPGSGGFDLASLNIQRGRDHGLPDYNAVRDALGLGRVDSFADITSDADLQSQLEAAYGSVDSIDLWVGVLAEDHVPGANVGECLQKMIGEQFTAIRDGDRFWYERTFSGAELSRIRGTRLSDVIARNTGLTRIQHNAFVAPRKDIGPPLASGQGRFADSQTNLLSDDPPPPFASSDDRGESEQATPLESVSPAEGEHSELTPLEFSVSAIDQVFAQLQ